MVLAAEPETDGSWTVTLAVPIEAVREAMTGRRKLAPGGDADDPAVIVDGVQRQARGRARSMPRNDLGRMLPPWAKDAPHVMGKA